MSEVRIREATRDDARLIIHYVRELAKFEREPVEKVKLTEAQVVRDGFGERRYFEVLLAQIDSAPVGFALFFHNYSTWEGRPGIYIEDLFVEERVRKLGVGRKLIAAVAKIAKARGCGRIDLSVLDWNPARGFYARLGFRRTEGWDVFRLGEPELTQISANSL
jgi:GNAT superfamily N-acetyltransferase